MKLLSLLGRGGRDEERKESESSSKRKKKREKDTQNWLNSLADDATVRIYQGSSYIASIEADELKMSEEPVEEIILNELGPGTYRLVPVDDNGVHNDKAMRIKVGRSEERVTVKRRYKTEELEAIKEYIDERLSKLDGGMKINLPELITAVSSSLATLSEILKGDSDKLAQMVSPILESSLKKDPTETIEKLMSAFKEFQSMIPPPVVQSPSNTPISSSEGNFWATLGQLLLGRLSNNSQRGEVQQPQLAGAEPAPAAKPAVSNLERQAFNFFISRVRDVVNRGGSAEDLAQAVLYMVDTANTWGIKHPLLDRFGDDPGGVFDEMISSLPEFNVSPGKEMAAEARKIIVDRVNQVRKEMEAEDVGESSSS